jgi:hypothetical protein
MTPTPTVPYRLLRGVSRGLRYCAAFLGVSFAVALLALVHPFVPLLAVFLLGFRRGFAVPPVTVHLPTPDRMTLAAAAILELRQGEGDAAERGVLPAPARELSSGVSFS